MIDISASQGHIVPTSIAERDWTLFVGNLNLFPIDPQWARILTISKSDSDDFYNLPPGLQPARGHRIVSSKAGFTTVSRWILARRMAFFTCLNCQMLRAPVHLHSQARW